MPLPRRLPRIALLVCWVGLCGAMAPTRAQDVLRRIHTDNTLRCGAEPRPGFADAGDDGRITGKAVDLCRALAIAVLGQTGRIEFRLYQAPQDFAALADGTDEVAFLSDDALAKPQLGGRLARGPAVFVEHDALMVPDTLAIHRVAELANKTICLMIGGSGQRALEATVAHLHITVARLAFEEDVEMLDAYNVGRCQVVVDTQARLEEMRQQRGINHMTSRILDEKLDALPIRAATGRSDPVWTDLVGRLLRQGAAAPGGR